MADMDLNEQCSITGSRYAVIDFSLKKFSIHIRHTSSLRKSIKKIHCNILSFQKRIFEISIDVETPSLFHIQLSYKL